MRCGIIGISNLETDFFTFAYDDDYVSKDFYKLIKCADKYNSTVIGNGIVIPKGSEYNFQSLKEPKKINLDYNDTAYTCGWYGSSTHWCLTWDSGGTAGGSSGSPIFDDQKRFVGDYEIPDVHTEQDDLRIF